ncbi:MAG: LysM peptidoglycan-binding domain-containing protein [Halanaerobium sp.]|nr:LysM peptidoglycan-binding domain-containing protein [Halanaerobium sp.]
MQRSYEYRRSYPKKTGRKDNYRTNSGQSRGLVNKKFVLITILTLLFVLVLPSVLYSMVKEPAQEVFHSIVVQPGDNLWLIAERYSEPETDLRKVVFNIKKANKLTSAKLIPGQKLRIPQQP